MTELKRTYHPIGQGAFYTEVFTNSDNTKFVMVYDCGTETANNVLDISLDDQIDDFKQSIGPDPHIDLLFLSHFHADHINGLDRLLDGVAVGKTIIPMLTMSVLLLTRVKNFLLYRDGAMTSDTIIRELYFDGEDSGRFGEVVVVPSENEVEATLGEKDRWLGNGKILSRGEQLLYDHYWEYIPFNSITPNDQRAIDFLNELAVIPEAINGQLNVNGLIRGCRTRVREHEFSNHLYK